MEAVRPVNVRPDPISLQPKVLAETTPAVVLALKASMKALVLSKLLPPPTVTSICTDVTPAGVVNVYQTSLVVAAHVLTGPSDVAL